MGLDGILGADRYPATEETMMYAAIRYRLARARLAELYCQILRDAAMYPAIHYDLARARIADAYHEAQRTASGRTAIRRRRRRALGSRSATGQRC
jgi:hypothetical protein